MPDQKEFWDKRERYQLTPDRYFQVPEIPSIRNLLTEKGEEWREKYCHISYADVGSGNCKGTLVFSDFLEKCARMPVDAIGIDASSQCEALCREKGLDYIQLDASSEAIPIKDLQVITLFETIEHIFNTDFLLDSIQRALSSDGVLLVTTLNVVCLKNRILVPLGIQPINTEVSTKKLRYGYRLNSLKKRVDTWQPAGHIRPFTLYSLCDMLEDNGFTVIRSYGLENWRALKFLERVAKNMCTGILVVAKPN